MTLQPCFVIPEDQAHTFDRYFREIGDAASCWAVSTAKHGNGVHPLRDNDSTTFWQSDGVLPHNVDIIFPKLVNVVAVAILLHGRTDDSYTPKKLVVRASCGVGDLSDVASCETQNPQGWVILQLTQDGSAPPELNNNISEFAALHQRTAAEQLEVSNSHNGSSLQYAWANGQDLGTHRSPLGMFATHIQICVLENHQQGRDTHIRGIKVFSPLHVAPYKTESFLIGTEIR
jgi:anaphase-promoting complex subunit 10